VNWNSQRAFFSQAPYSKKGYTSWSIDSFCNNVCYLIDNIYIQFGGTVFQQTIGIPMGTNCAPLLADLFLLTYEYDYLAQLTKKDIHQARKFNLSFRYIDDLLCANNR
jgi:hypothetical protein